MPAVPGVGGMAQVAPESSAPCKGQEVQGLGAASAAGSELQRASSLPTSYRVWCISDKARAP